jgi:DNA polymerase elongation subunit (family B)
MNPTLKTSYLLNEFIAEFPTRDYFADAELKTQIDLKLKEDQPIEFLPNNPNEESFPMYNDPKKWAYSIAMFGILPDGRRAIVMIDGIKPYFLLEKPKLAIGTYPGELPPNATPEEFNKINAIAKMNFEQSVRSRIPAADAPCEYSWENGKPFVGWQLEYSDYLKLSFTKQSSRKKALTLLRQFGYVTAHDDYTDYYRVVARDFNIPLCSWVTLTDYKRETLAQFKQPVFRVSVDNFKKYSGEVLKVPALARDKSMILAWDIECATQTGNLPTADNMNDKLFMIAASVHWWYQKTPLAKICFVDLPADSHKDYITVICGSEKNVILGFAYMIEKLKPDFCTGFNSSNFDYPWLVQRAYQYGILEAICDIMNEKKPFNGFGNGKGQGLQLGHKLYSTSFESWLRRENTKKIPLPTMNNYLSNICSVYQYEKVKIDAETYAEGRQLQFAGCISFDLMTIFRQLYPNSEKNSLDYFLNANNLGGKKDMPVHELFRIYWELNDIVKTAHVSLNSEDPNIRDQFLSKVNRCKREMREVAEYCVVDSYRCQELSLMRNVIADKREVSALSYTSLSDAFFRANGMKVRQMVMARGISRGLKFTTVNKTEHGKEKYPGAYVLPPEKGLINSKLTIEERLTKSKEFTSKFGTSAPQDGSFRTVPYPEIQSFGNSNNDTASVSEDTDKVISSKIAALQDSIKEYAQENKLFTVTNMSDDESLEIINKAADALSANNIRLNASDKKILKDFLKEETGRPITGLDFSSLYPSLIMNYNLSPEYTIAMETCAHSTVTVMNKILQAQNAGNLIQKVKFPYGESKQEIIGFFIKHENQFPEMPDGVTPNPACKFGIYPTILKELFDARNVMKVPKEYYEILNEYLDKLNDSTIKYNMVIKICSPAYSESIELDKFKDFESLIDEFNSLKVIKSDDQFSKMSWQQFTEFMSYGPTEKPKVERITLSDAVTVILNKIDFDHAYRPPKRISTTSVENVKKILCKFEDEEVIISKGGITWEDIEFYFNYFDSKQKALKVFMNTFYGESGNKLSSMFVLAVAGSITTMGQSNIKMVKDFVEGRETLDIGDPTRTRKVAPNTVGKFSVKYGDTDSLYIAAPESAFRDVDIAYYSGQITKEQYWSQMVDISFDYIDKIKKQVNKMLAETSGSKFLKMSYEEVLFPVAFLAKKKYYGIPHISIPNFNPKKLFVRGLEVKKRGVSGVLRDLCEDLMWKSMRLANNKELLELAYDAIEDFYKKTWDLDRFAKTSQYKPKSDEDIAEGKGNKSVLRFVERMKARGIVIKPHERFRYVIVRKYPFEYDYRGRKRHLQIGDFMELLEVAKSDNMEIDIDYYMENGIIGQLARLTVYRDEFFIESIDDSDEEIKKADDASFKRAKAHLNEFASQYYKDYQDKGDVYKHTFKLIDKKLKTTYKGLGINKQHVDLICNDWDYESPDTFYSAMAKSAETKSIRESKGFGKNFVQGMLKPKPGVQPVELTTLQRLYCGPNATNMKSAVDIYRQNLLVIERDFRNMFNDFYKFMNEHRRAINVMTLLVNKAIGIEQLYNNPMQGDKKTKKKRVTKNGKDSAEYNPENYEGFVMQLDIQAGEHDSEHDSDHDGSGTLLDSIKDQFPEGEFEALFKETETHLVRSFNIHEVANRLAIINSNLYKTYLYYNQYLDIQTYLESCLDKKYRIGAAPISRAMTAALVEEGIEEGLQNNIIDIEF